MKRAGRGRRNREDSEFCESEKKKKLEGVNATEDSEVLVAKKQEEAT